MRAIQTICIIFGAIALLGFVADDDIKARILYGVGGLVLLLVAAVLPRVT